MASRDNGRTARVSHAPASQEALGRGIAVLERTLGSTLGPCGRQVAITPIGRPGHVPELLDDGGLIARRIIGLADPFENMGFMLARQAAWAMRSQWGDGASTAVAIMGATFRKLDALATAGFDRVALRRGVETELIQALQAIDRFASPFTAHEAATFVQTRMSDQALGRRICQVIEAMGLDTVIDARAGNDGKHRLDLIEGAFWETTNLVSPLHDHALDATRLVLEPANLLLWDAEVQDVAAMAATLERLRSCGIDACTIVARAFSPVVTSMLRQNNRSDFRIIPVVAPQAGVQQEDVFADLSVLTGARVCSPVSGDVLGRVAEADLGHSPKIVVGARFLNVQLHRSQEASVSERLSQVEDQIQGCISEQELQRLQLRAARLQQKLAVLWVGAPGPSARAVRLAETRQVIGQLGASKLEGTVPGAGAMLAHIATGVMSRGCRGDDPGALAVVEGFLAPARWIARNAGLEASVVVESLRSVGPEQGLDARAGSMVNLRETGIVDPAAVLKAAVTTGLTMAMQASDCEVLVRRDIGLRQADLTP